MIMHITFEFGLDRGLVRADERMLMLGELKGVFGFRWEEGEGGDMVHSFWIHWWVVSSVSFGVETG